MAAPRLDPCHSLNFTERFSKVKNGASPSELITKKNALVYDMINVGLKIIFAIYFNVADLFHFFL